MNRLFVLINQPVWRKTPYVVRVLQPTSYVENLYKNQHYEHEPFLTKKEVESLGEWPDCGPRYSLLELNVKNIDSTEHS